jgi:hypothetical protein
MHESDRFEEHKHDGALIFACFFGSALAGYFLAHLTDFIH